MSENYTFKHNGKEHALNGVLIELQGIDVDACHRIANLHREKMAILDCMSATDCSEKVRLHELYDEVRDIEFRLQEAWGFSRNEGWHKHWKVPHCMCPRMDNMDAYPYRKYISGACAVHGDLEKQND